MEEILRLFELLPAQKRSEVIAFAKFLLERHSDEEWERIIADSNARPKLERFVSAALAEGSETLDPDRL